MIKFSGVEAISQTYEFDILLVSSNLELDVEDILQHNAQLLIHRGNNEQEDVLFNGNYFTRFSSAACL